MSEKNREFQGLGMQVSPTALPCPNGQLYTIKPGDTLFFIARRNNISLQSIIDANPQLTDPNTIFPGQIICIPTVGPGVSCPNGQIYRVVRGDTMFEIANRNGISLESLVRANPQIADPNRIFPGQEICVPLAPRPNCPDGILYTVQSGDTLYEIARRNNISLTSLITANPQITNPNLILPGQEICIPTGGTGIPFSEEPIPLPTPIPLPIPLPEPIPPIAHPMPSAPAPIRPPMPLPCPPGMIQGMMPPFQGARPCPPKERDMMPMCPMPFYIQIPWEECPYRDRKKKKRRCKRCH